MEKRFKKLTQMALVLMICIFLSACNQGDNSIKGGKGNQVRGGEMVRYSLCIEEDSSQIVSCPIITNRKAKTISLNNYVSNQKDGISLTVSSIDLNECVTYNGYYVYFAVLNIECTTYERSVNANIEKLVFDIDNEIVEYDTPYFNVKNTYYYTQNLGCLVEEDCIKISGEFTGLYSAIPIEEKKADLTITSSEDIILKSYTLSDFLKVESLDIDGNQHNPGALDIELEKGRKVVFEYALGKGENINEDSIIRVSQILIYECDGKDYLWVYTSGVYIWNDYSDYGNIKRYIDTF